jgi:glutathione S-transferase
MIMATSFAGTIMSGIILYHYPESPFSEKIRLLLGYKKATYQTVKVPIIQPKPELAVLAGGYRKTPVMQIGADVYCDTALMARVIDRMYPENSIYPASLEAVSGGLAHWTDTFFFKVAVAVAFQPRGLGSTPLFADEKAAAAFMADRAEFTRGSTELGMDLQVALPYFVMHLKRLDQQLACAPYLFGAAPTIADFSTFHICWFVHNNATLRDTFAPYTHVLAWMTAMAEIGHGQPVEITGTEGLLVARDASPEPVAKMAALQIEGLQVGDVVDITPIDYGLFPVRGALQLASLEELVLLREDPQVGQVAVHFPRLGFKVEKVI